MDRSATTIGVFEELVLYYWRHIFALAYRVLGNYQDAEDQTQEVFLKVYRSISTLDNPHALRAWITKITLNTCYDALAYQRRRLSTVPLDLLDDLAGARPGFTESRQPTPEQAAVRAEACCGIAAALERLDPCARRTLVLRDVEGRSYQEIGQLLHLRPSAVKMRIRRARLAFRELLAAIDPDLRRIEQASGARRPALSVPD